MSEQKSALDKLIASTSSHWPTLTPKARAELAQLRATVAEQARRITELEGAVDRAMAQIENGDIRLALSILQNAYNAPAPQADSEK